MTVLLVLGMLTAGCGEEQTAQARGIITKGDAGTERLDAELAAYLARVDRAVSVLQSTPPESWLQVAEGFGEQVGALRANYSALNVEVEKITAEYKKVFDLQGVPDYQKYADMRTQYVAIVDRQLENVEDYIGEFFDLWGEMVNNPPPDTSIVLNSIQEIVTEYRGREDPLDAQKQQLAQQAELFKWQYAL